MAWGPSRPRGSTFALSGAVCHTPVTDRDVRVARLRSGKQADMLVTAAAAALEQGDFAKAEKLAVEAFQADPQASVALRIAGDAAAEQSAFDRSLAYYAKIPAEDRLTRCQGCNGAARVLMVGKPQLSSAEAKFRQALSLQPNDLAALDSLSFLLLPRGRRWESAQFYLRLLQNGRVQLGHLLGLGVLEYQLNESVQLQKCLRRRRWTRSPRWGWRLALGSNDNDTGAAVAPHRCAAGSQAAGGPGPLGPYCCSTVEISKAWPSGMPHCRRRRTSIRRSGWCVRWAQQTQDPRGAVHCYLEALRRDPNHQLAASQVSVVLFSLGETRSGTTVRPPVPATAAVS